MNLSSRHLKKVFVRRSVGSCRTMRKQERVDVTVTCHNGIMGNSISGHAASRTGGALDSFVSELGADVTCERRFILLFSVRLNIDN